MIPVTETDTSEQKLAKFPQQSFEYRRGTVNQVGFAPATILGLTLSAKSAIGIPATNATAL